MNRIVGTPARLLRPIAAKISGAALRPAAVTGSRVMSGRVPLPTPAWKQSADLDNIIPSDMDQATGLERAEMLASLAGKKLFEEKALSGPFGTEAAPVQVESIYDERIVGCAGDCRSDNSASNELRWFVVTSKSPYICASCGQVFAIKKISGDEYNF